jgi:AraC-like DNA-binding protein
VDIKKVKPMATSSLSTAHASHVRFDARVPRSPRQPNLRLLDCRSVFSGAPVAPTDRHGDRLRLGRAKPEAPCPSVEISPAEGVKRRAVSWPGMTAEIVQATSSGRIEYRSHAHVHLLVLCERGARREGETYIEGLPRSTLRDVTRKLTFVPAGHEYCDWHEPRTAVRMVFFYFDPATLPVPATSDEHEVSLAPRLFFEDAALFATAQKLTALIEGPASDDCYYLEALGRVLAHELMRVNQGNTQGKQAVRGGLAAWQQRIVTAYIEEHLSESVPLAQLAGLVSLSSYHFCRAFKQSCGLPPHRYHTSRRIERAKALLSKPVFSVTDIGLTLGFSETSSFTAAFRKATGLTPTAYHRSLA